VMASIEAPRGTIYTTCLDYGCLTQVRCEPTDLGLYIASNATKVISMLGSIGDIKRI
jgi:hypothetical protein